MATKGTTAFTKAEDSVTRGGGEVGSLPSGGQMHKEHLREAKASYAAHCPSAFVVVDIGIGAVEARRLHAAGYIQPYAAIDYVQSWRSMGKLDVRCVDGCNCNGTMIDAHSSERTTVRRQAQPE